MQQVIYQKPAESCSDWNTCCVLFSIFNPDHFDAISFGRKKKTTTQKWNWSQSFACRNQDSLSYAFSFAHSPSIDIDIKLLRYLMEKETIERLLMQISVVCSHSGKFYSFYFSWNQPVVITIAISVEQIKQ